MGKLRVAAADFQKKLDKGKVLDNEFYVVLCSSNNTQFNLSRHLTNTFQKLQLHAGITNFEKIPNFVLLHQPSEVPPSKKEFSLTMNKDFLKSQCVNLTKSRIFEVFENRTVNTDPFVRIGEFRIVNRYGPYKEVFDIDPKNHNIDHPEFIKSIRKITKIGSHCFSDFQKLVLAVICSKFCPKCLEGLLKSIKSEAEVEEMIGMIMDGVEVPVDTDNAKEGWEWLDDEGKPYKPQMFREEMMDRSWKDRLIIESDSSDSDKKEERKTMKTPKNRKIPPKKSPEKINLAPKIPESQLYQDDDEPLTDSRKKAYQSVLEKLEINLGTLESSRRSKTSRFRFQSMFETIFSTNEEMNVYAELIDKIPKITENGIDKETMKTVIGWLEWKLRKKGPLVKKVEEKPKIGNVFTPPPKPKGSKRPTKRKIVKRKSNPQTDSDCSEKSISPKVRRKKPTKKTLQKVEELVKKEPEINDVSEFDSSSDFESFNSRIIQKREQKTESEGVQEPIEIPDVVKEELTQISPPESPEVPEERPVSRRTVQFASDPSENSRIPIFSAPRTSDSAPAPITAPIITNPPAISAPKSVIKSSIFSQLSNTAPNPVTAPINTIPPSSNSARQHVIRASVFPLPSTTAPNHVTATSVTMQPSNSAPRPVIRPSIFPQSSSTAPNSVTAPIITMPPSNRAPQPVIKPTIFPQSSNTASSPVTAPINTIPPSNSAPKAVIRSSIFPRSSSTAPKPVITRCPPGTKSLLSLANPLRSQSVLPAQSVRYLSQAMSDRYLIRATTPLPSFWEAPPPGNNLPGPSNSAFQNERSQKRDGN